MIQTVTEIDGWAVSMTWTENPVGGPIELTIKPSNPDKPPVGGLSQVTLRELCLTKLKPKPEGCSKAEISLLREMAREGKITDNYLALLSKVYCSLGENPMQPLANTIGKSHAATKNNLWLATRKGYLKRSPGRSGGVLSDEAERIVRQLIG